MLRHREIFEGLRTRTGMYVGETTYVAVAAFVVGYDEACEGGTLAGFREWLAVRMGSGSNLAWTAIVLRAAFPGSDSPEAELAKGPQAERRAIETMFELISAFDDERNRRDGLRKIFASYEDWEGAGRAE